MKTKLLFLFFLSGVLFSCTEDTTLSNVDQTKIDSDIYISVIDTSSVVDTQKVEHIAQLFQKKNLYTRITDSDREIENINTVKSDKGNILMYIINYKDNRGFIIISATQSYQPILAYSDTGTYDIEKAEKTGASVWLNEQKSIVSSIDEIPDSIKKAFRREWARYNTRKVKLAITRSENEVREMILRTIRKWESEGYTVFRYADINATGSINSLPGEVITQLRNAVDSADPRYGGRGNVTFLLQRDVDNYTLMNPLLETTWGQEHGFNEYTPNNYPAGCVAVAMGQIMRHYKYPSKFDWNSMYSSFASSVTANFLYDIGINVNMNYGSNGSESDIDKALSAFKNKYGYTKAVKIDHSKSNVIGELKSNRPVYMRGYDSSGFLGFRRKGHAWVCDGYSSSQLYTELVVALVDDYTWNGTEPTEIAKIYTTTMNGRGWTHYHMNWGWYGTNDGYFSDGNLWMNTSEGSYNPAHGREDITNIYPSK